MLRFLCLYKASHVMSVCGLAVDMQGQVPLLMSTDERAAETLSPSRIGPDRHMYNMPLTTDITGACNYTLWC